LAMHMKRSQKRYFSPEKTFHTGISYTVNIA